MLKKCSNCGSLNIDEMTECGNCGASLAQAEHVEIEVKKTETEYASDESSMKCPYCGGPMEEGTFEIPSQQAFRPLWVGRSGEEPIGAYSPLLYDFDGYRCKSCSCIVFTY